MSFTASEYHNYYQVKPCALRVYLRAKGVQAAEPDAYHQLLAKLGQRHEQRHLNRFGAYFDARGDVQETIQAVARGETIIYQPEMKAIHPDHGDVVGRPDFFIKEDNGYVIGDCKLSRRFNENDHPEIFRQLQLYGWLYEQTFGVAPIRIEAYMGDGQTQIVPQDFAPAMESMRAIQKIKQLQEEPFEAIGWSKCLDCPYNEYCWKRAEEKHSVAMLPGVDQALAHQFYQQKISAYDELLLKYNEDTLADVQRDVAGKRRKVGNGARKILNHAKAFQKGELIRLQAPAVIKVPNLVMFDVEGIPPHLDYSKKTYLWGLKIFGDRPRVYSPALATAAPEGDCEGWLKFLSECKAIFAEYGSIPFVHWSSYEKTQLAKYVKNFGDNDDIASRVSENLYDLRPVVENAFVLPTPSYSLKLIEKIAGYKRTLAESGGKWSMATYIEAIETKEPSRAAELMGEILKYNEEDLNAMWFVYRWLVKLG